jgi:RNA polymerase sigma-70 factor (ECF subfamily)
MLAVECPYESEEYMTIGNSDVVAEAPESQAGMDLNRKNQFEELFIPFIDGLYNMAMRMTRNPEDAEDLVQETYLKAYRFFGNFRTNTNPRAWIITIMMNAFRTRYRKVRKEPVKVDYDAVENMLPADDYDPAQRPANKSETRNLEDLTEYMRSVVSDDVIKALESVPLRFRMPVLLSDAEQFNYQEISEILGINIGTVKSRIFRGRKLLKKNLFQFAASRGICRTSEN